MKRNIFFLLLVAVLAAGVAWLAKQTTTAQAAISHGAAYTARKILYYQSPMHPWIKSDKPGKCPICGMNLVPVYASDDEASTGYGLKLNADSINVADIRTTPVENRRIIRSLRVGGAMNASGPSAWFIFTAYERDFAWLATNESVEVTIPASPGKTYTAKITAIDSNTNDPTHSLRVRAVLSENLPRTEDGFYSEGRVIVDIPDVLTVPRSAVLSPNGEPFVFVYAGGGHYEPRKLKLGRIGDDYAEVLDGLKPQEKVVTSGNLLIDSETQISQSTEN